MSMGGSLRRLWLIPAGSRGLFCDGRPAFGGQPLGPYLPALFTADTAESYEMRISRIDLLFERGSVHVLTDCLLNYLAGNLHEIALLARRTFALADHGFLLFLGLLRSNRDICFCNSAACALSVAACSISLAAVSSNSLDSRRSCSEVDSPGTGISCHRWGGQGEIADFQTDPLPSLRGPAGMP